MIRFKSKVYACLALLAALPVATPVHAAPDDSRQACFTEYEQAQRLRKAGKLLASKEQLALCSDTVCPPFVVSDCATWAAEVDRDLPGVVVVMTNDADGIGGRVSVTVDQALRPVGGSPMPVDPGPHEVRYEVDGRSAETRIMVPAGAKAFPLVLDLRAVSPPHEDVTVTRPASGDTRPWYGRFSIPTYVFGGVAATGALSFSAFAIAGKSAEGCAPSCTRSQVNSLRSDYLAADLSLVTALVAGAGAVYFALTSSNSPAQASPRGAGASAAGWWFGGEVERGGAAISAGARF
jgi:hypothetical protein